MEARTFGTRLLTDDSKILEHNAWDHVEWSQELLDHAAERLAFQEANMVAADCVDQYGDSRAASHWNIFYETHREGTSS